MTNEFEAALVGLHGNGHDLGRGVEPETIAEASGLPKSAVVEIIRELQSSGRAYSDKDANAPQGITVRLRATSGYLGELGLNSFSP